MPSIDVPAACRRVLALVAGVDEKLLLSDLHLEQLSVDSSYAAAIPVLLDAEIGIYINQSQLQDLLSAKTVADFIRKIEHIFSISAHPQSIDATVFQNTN